MDKQLAGLLVFLSRSGSVGGCQQDRNGGFSRGKVTFGAQSRRKPGSC